MTKGQFGLNLAAVAILGFVLAFFGFLEALFLLVAYALLIEKDPWLTRQTLQALYLKLAYNIVVVVIGWVFKIINDFFGLFSAYKVINALTNVNNFIDTVLYIVLFLVCALAVTRLLKEHDADVPLVSNLAGFTMDKAPILKTAHTAPAAPAASAAPAAPAQTPAALVQPIAPAAPAAKPVSPFQPPVAAVPAAPAVPAATPVVPVSDVAPAPVTVPPAETAPEIPVETVPAPVGESAEGEAPAAAVPEPSQPQAPVAPAVPAGHWICSCGRVNAGNFCMNCGSPRKS